MSGQVKGANDNTTTPPSTETTPRDGVRLRADLGKESLRPPHPKRFYVSTRVAPRAGGHTVLLDGRPLKSPSKADLVVPTSALAGAIAAEWDEQGDRIDPTNMPLTRLANTTIDAVVAATAEVAADIVAFACNDALCYRAHGPAGLVSCETENWDAVLGWAASALGAKFATTTGIVHIEQSPEAGTAIAQTVSAYSAWELAPLHVMTTLTGSAILALAVAIGHLTPEAAWTSAHVGEDWQISQWGSDLEAERRRAERRREMLAAALFLALVRQTG